MNANPRCPMWFHGGRAPALLALAGVLGGAILGRGASPSWNDAAERLRANLALAHNIQFNVEHVLKSAEPGTGPVPVETGRLRMNYRGASDRFLLECTSSGPGGVAAHSERAFDGTFSQYLDAKGMLHIRSGPLQDAQEAEHMLPLFLPFEFLAPYVHAIRGNGNKPFIPSPADFANPEVWRAFAANAPPLEPGLSHTNLVFRRLKSVDFLLDANCDAGTDFEVSFLANGDLYPVKWRKTGVRTKGRAISIEFEALQLDSVSAGDGRAIRLPVKFAVRYYLGTFLSWMRESSISFVRVNEPSFNEVFTIDPAKAKSVFDLDANRIIDVPK